MDSQASPPEITVFSESLNLYSLSTYTVSDKFLNEYHRPNRWRIIQTQIRNTRELVKYPGECLFPAHFACPQYSFWWPHTLTGCKCHHADDTPIYIPVLISTPTPKTPNSHFRLFTSSLWHCNHFCLKRSKTEIIFSQPTSQVIPFPEFPMWVSRILFSQVYKQKAKIIQGNHNPSPLLIPLYDTLVSPFSTYQINIISI